VDNACLDEAFKRQRLLVESRRHQAARRMEPGEARTAAFSESRKKIDFTDATIQHHAIESPREAAVVPLRTPRL